MASRGGSRPRFAPQRNNHSGLLGISFRWHRKRGSDVYHPEVCIVVGERRYTRGLTKREPRDALREAIRLRAAANLPRPTLAAAIAAFSDWIRHG